MRSIVMSVLSALVLSACAGAAVDVADDPTDTTTPGATGDVAPTATTDTTGASPGDVDLPPDLEVTTSAWNTDFTITSIDLAELKVGIRALDPRDLIPPIDEPVFETVDEASSWLADDEPGLSVEVGGETRFYPLSILHRHEIVNDVFGETPVAVTYCPLCNTGIAFDRSVDGAVHRFGVSGLLRNSDLVMWDDRTESLWQQITGEAIVGEMTGTMLRPLPSAIVRWADFAADRPGALVLGRDQGFGIPYGANPYVSYSSRNAPIGAFFTADLDDRFPALERVVGVGLDGEDVAYPFSLLSEVRVVNDEVAGRPVAVFWGAPSTADALDSFEVADGRAIGTGLAFDPTVDGRRLTFESPEVDVFVDVETGSTWTLQGEATAGPLAGTRLELVPHRNEFWFAFAAFFPEARVFE